MANGTINTKPHIQASINSKNTPQAQISAGGGTADHSRLINRDAVDQHPISAITGLNKLLNSKLDSSTVLPLIQDAANNRAAGLFYDVNKELAKKSYWYLTSKIDPVTKMGTKESVISGPYDLGMGGGTGGGSTGGVTTVTLTKTNPETLENMWPTAISVGSSCEIGVYWTSLRDTEATGSGALSLYINDKLVSKKTYKQGIVLFDITDNVVSGDNKIEVRVQDAYSTTKNIIGNITGVTLTIESTFDDSIAYQGDILYTYKAYGDIEKTVHFVVDGKELEPAVIKTTGETSNYLIKNLSHGSHTLLVYFTVLLAGDEIRSNSLYYDLIHFIIGNNTPIIASTFLENSEAEQYVSFNLPYRVYTPGKNLSDVNLYINGIKYGETLSVDQALHFWAYRPLDVGNYILEIRTGDIGRTFNVHAIESQVKVELAATGLSMALNADGRSNAEPMDSRLKWEDKDHAISCILTGFNWSSNGWMTDKNNNPILRLAGSARVEIPYKPFAKDFTQTGKTFEFEIATSDIKAYDSMIIQCLDGGDAIDKNVWLTGEDDRTKKFTIGNLDEVVFLDKILKEYGSYIFTYKNGTWILDNLTISETELASDYGITLAPIDLDSTDPSANYFMDGDRIAIDYKVVGMGFYITPQLAKLQAQQTSLSTQYKEDDNVRLTFVVENRQENRLVSMYINGIMSGVTVYPTSESFRQTTPQNITIGSSDATVDIYNLRIYDTALSRKQVVNNWIADTQDIILKSDRFYSNDNYDETGNIVINKLPGTTPYMILTAEKLPSYKKDKKPVDVEFVYPGDNSRSFISEGATADVQGTSSQYYYRKNFKIKFENGFIDNEGNVEKKYKIQGPMSKKEKTFTFKADVASSEGTNNVELVRYFELTKNWYSPAELDQDPEDTADGYDTKDRVRVGIDGFPMVMFHDDGNGPKFYGKMNFNNDKANDSTFGFIEGDECWEFTNNSSKLVLFKTADMKDWANSFESRYPEDVADDNGIEHAFGTMPGETDKLAHVITWVNSTERLDTDSEEEKAAKLVKFKSELPSYFDKDSSLFYYLYTELFLMVDSRAKNAMLAYYKSRTIGDGGNKWFWLPYDMDTALGINNEGLLVFDYDVEDTDLVHGTNVYNGQQSVFWNNLRDAYKDELTKMYADLRAKAWSFDTIEKMYEDHQAVWSETIFNEDSYTKYLEPLMLNNDASYLGMAQGSKAEQRRWWLFNRFRYLDSKYRTGDAADQNIMLRVYKKGNLTITPYINCHVTATYDQAANFVTVDAEKNVPVVLESPEGWDPNNSDALLAIYSADMLKDVGDLSTFKPGYANFSAATKLQKLKIGSTEPGYANEKLTGLMVGNNHLLTEIDARNCTSLGSSTSSTQDTSVTPTIDLSGCVSIERAYFDNTKVLGVQFPVGGYLQEVHLPGSITMLEIRNHPSLKILKLDGTNNLQSLWLENISSEAIDAYSIVSQMKEGCAVRLIGIDNKMTTDQIKSFYDRLDLMTGKDIHGDTTDKAQVTGKIYVDSISFADYAILQNRYSEIIIIPTEVKCLVRFMNEEYVTDTTEYTEFNSQIITCKTTYNSDNKPVTIISKPADEPGIPTKASTVAYHYSFNHWNHEFTAINTDLTIYPVYDSIDRTYRVFFDTCSDAISVANNEQYIVYNHSCELPYLDDNALPENVVLDCWQTADGTQYSFIQDSDTGKWMSQNMITEDITLYAKWIDPTAPTLTLTRLTANTFNISCLDDVGLTAISVVKSDVPLLKAPLGLTWKPIKGITHYSEDYTITDKGYWTVFVKDSGDHVEQASLKACGLSVEILTEGFITVNFSDTESNTFVDSYALVGTSVVVNVEIDPHYSNEKIYVNGNLVYNLDDVYIISDSENQLEVKAECFPRSYAVYFDTMSIGKPIAPQLIVYKNYAKTPSPQFEDDQIIDGWYTNQDFAEEHRWNFQENQVLEETTLYAKWLKYYGTTEITLNITDYEKRTTHVSFEQKSAHGVRIDWGDESAVQDSGETPGDYTFEHTYDNIGTYVLKVTRLSGIIYLGNFTNGEHYPAISPIENVVDILFPPDVAYTNSYALAGAINLKEITITPYMTAIADGMFKDCTNATKINFAEDNQVTKIGNEAFSSCTNISGPVILPELIKIIGNSAFTGCSKVTKYSLPLSLIEIGEYAFAKNSSLIEVPLTEEIIEIKRGAYSSCNSLVHLNLPASVKSLGESSFEWCTSLSSVTLNNPNLTMGKNCFSGCNLLTSAGPITNIGADYHIKFAWIESIPDNAFSASFNGTYLRTIDFPTELKAIGNSAFYNQLYLDGMVLPSILTSIGASAFEYCGIMQTMEIPALVSYIGNNAFNGCFGLHTLKIWTTINENKIQISENSIISNCDRNRLSNEDPEKGIHISASLNSIEKVTAAFGNYWNYIDNLPIKYIADLN